MKTGIVAFILFFFVYVIYSAQPAVKNIPEGWTHELLYQTEFITPHSLCLNADNKLLVLDISLNKISIMDDDFNFSDFIKLDSLHLDLIAYQSNLNRLIALSGRNLYYYENNSFHYLNTLKSDISAIAINPENDYIYAASQFNHSPIEYYNADGVFIETLVKDAQGCTQLAYDNTNKKLFYSETFPGRLMEYDIQSKQTKVLVTGLGIPDTDEGIAVALDDQNNLYFFSPSVATSSYGGLYLYTNGNAAKIMGLLIPAVPAAILCFMTLTPKPRKNCFNQLTRTY